MAKAPRAEHRGTVKKALYFNPEKDAGMLHTNLRGMGGDDSAIIALASTRTCCQRQEIAKLYKGTYGRDMIHDIKNETRGDFQEALVALFESQTEFDARCLRKAMKGLATDEKTLIEILTTRSNKEIKKIKQFYREKYNKEIEKDISSDVGGELQEILLMLLSATRDESITASTIAAKQDASALHKEQLLRTNGKTFPEIFCKRSYTQLRAIFAEYEKVSGRDIMKTIGTEFSGDVKELLKTIVEVANDTAAYFAERLYRSMKGAGTDDSSLIRIIVTRSEVDMLDIKKCFLDKHGKPLEKYIEGDTSGDYKKLLISLVTE